MVKHTRRRGGTWYDPRTWSVFGSSSTDSTQEQAAPANTQSDFGVGAPTPTSSTLGGRKGKKSRRSKRRGTKSRRKH